MNKAVVGLIGCICVVSLIANFLQYERHSSNRPLFDIGGQVIRRSDLDSRLDTLYSRSVLRSLIVEDVIDQAAKKQGVLPSDADVAQEIAQTKLSEPQIIDQQYALDPTMKLYKATVRARLALQNLQLQGVTVTSSEVAAYYAQHQHEFRTQPRVTAIIALAQNGGSAAAAASDLDAGMSPGNTANQSGADILGLTVPQQPLPTALEQKMRAMTPGAVQIVQTGAQQYYIVQIVTNTRGHSAPLASVLPQVEMAARLAKAPTPQQELAKLMACAAIKPETSRYADAVPNHDPQPTP